jgi:hypothetical protein
MGDAPPHDEHEHEPKGEEEETGKSILHPDHLMISGKDVFLDEIDFVVVVVGIMTVVMAVIRVLGV